MKKITKQWSELNINPVFGCLGPKGEGNCWYCYAKATAKWSNRYRKPHCGLCDEFKPHPHLENLENKGLRSKKPKVVFVDGHFDWNGVDVKKEWLEAILATPRIAYHSFSFSTLTVSIIS